MFHHKESEKGRLSIGRSTALCVFCVFAISAAGFALDPDKAITQYVHDVWGIEQGLPQNGVNTILQTRDGYLWLGTEEGLARFDGARFTAFDTHNTPELKSNLIWTLYEDHQGSLWVGTDGGGLSRFKSGKWNSYTTAEGMADNFVRAVVEDRDGALWIGTRDGGLNLFKEGKFTSYTTKDGLSSNKIRALCVDHEGSLWIGTYGNGLNLLQDGKWSAYTTKDGLSDDTIWSIYEDREGSLWIGTDGGLNRLRGGKWSAYTIKDGLSNKVVWSIYGDREGSLWIGTWGGGLNRLRNGKWSAYTTREGLSKDTVWSIYEDREGSLWIGTYGGGLNRLRDGKWSTYTTKEGLSNDTVWSIYEDRQGSLWIGTFGGGLNRLRDGKWSAWTIKEGLSNDFVSSIYEDREGSLWIGTDGGGLNRLRDGKWSTYTTKEGLSSNSVYSIYEDREGSLWIGTDSGGLNRLRDGKWSTYTTKEGLSSNTVRCIYQDHGGSLWIGTDGGGLNRLRNGKWSAYTTKEGLSNNIVYSIHEDREGDLWLGTNGGGLNRLHNGKFNAFTAKNGFFDDVVYATLEDDSGNLWMSCNKGIFRVSKKELDDFAESRIKRITSVSYGTADGMKSRECNGGDPAAWKTRDGRLWFATIAGGAVIDPEHIRMNNLAPPVYVEKVLADNQPLTVERNSVAADNSGGTAIMGRDARHPEVLAVPAGKKNFEFHYTALSFLVPERVKFKYKLEEFDRDWVDADTRRIAYYTNIPPGDYTFRVKARNDDGVWNEGGASLAFYLKPRFYQTWWFYGLCFLAAAAMVIGAHHVRVRQLKAREKDLTLVVEAKTRDLRDANDKLYRANDNLHQANEKLEQAQERIDRLQQSAPQALDNLAVWSKAAAEDIANAIGASDIAIWILEEGGLKLAAGKATKAPSLEDLRTARAFTNIVADTGETIVPLMGLSGELYGALIISGDGITWGEAERRLIAGFAHQLGGTLETQRMAKRLAQAEERKALKMQEMHGLGIHTLQVCPKCGSCYDDTEESCELDGAKLDVPRTLPYRIMDRYRLSRMLGEGGMGTVFQAHDEKLNRSVAVKIIKAELLNVSSIRIRLEREARTVARIQHPGVVSIYDFGEISDGSAFIVMELLHGVDLARVLKLQGPGSPTQVAELLSQVGAALTAAHSQGVIHRDLKPANLFMIPSGSGFHVKVVDFGLAKSLGEETSLTISGMLVGSPAYMSPEQIRQQPLDARSDLFSLAVLSYELLTGVVAFRAEYISDVLTKVLLEDPPPLSSKLERAPAELDLVFFEALQKSPEKRPESVAAWIEQIQPYLAKLPASVSGWRLEVIPEMAAWQISGQETIQSTEL